MNNEELIKKMENLDLPSVKVPNHELKLKMALLNSGYFERNSMSKFKKMSPIVGGLVVAAFALFMVFSPKTNLASAHAIAQKSLVTISQLSDQQKQDLDQHLKQSAEDLLHQALEAKDLNIVSADQVRGLVHSLSPSDITAGQEQMLEQKISALQSDQTVFLQFTDANGKVVSMAIDANHLPAYSFAAQTSDESNIRFLIDSFGAKLKNVSLLAPTAKSDIDKNYKDYVAPQLLAEWEANPEKAMGRLTSSPWPDGIMIATITNTGNDTYRVSAKLLEVTSTEVTTNSALMEPITIEVQKIDGSWKIISAQRD